MAFCLDPVSLTVFQITIAIKARQSESPLPESELVQCLWQGLMGSVDWSTRADQIEGLALREVTVNLVTQLPSLTLMIGV